MVYVSVCVKISKSDLLSFISPSHKLHCISSCLLSFKLYKNEHNFEQLLNYTILQLWEISYFNIQILKFKKIVAHDTMLILKTGTVMARSHLIKYFLTPNISSLHKNLTFYTEALSLTQVLVLYFHLVVLATADPSSNYMSYWNRGQVRPSVPCHPPPLQYISIFFPFCNPHLLLPSFPSWASMLCSQTSPAP